ncbi:GDP-mannose 4,6-dehydratase [Enterococcus casseliflavus]|uniref:GDP-mannose 4,6-dehydratase n=1 Tax=Enterococcus casseliflavus TaxID=37734 RepID=UPI0035DAF274
MRKSILITGAAGFIGSNLVERLLKEYEDCIIVGIDNLNDYYDVSLKEYRLANLKKYNNFVFVKGNIADKEIVSYAFEKWKPTVVVNLAAQAGVRYSITNPNVYIESNILGFQNILESCREYAENIKHLIFASSSSVYGLNTKVPYSVKDKADSPVSLYAATKKSNELMAHSYSKLYNIPVTGLRFFTVYGPAGRPDMAYFNFANNLINKNRIKIFNYGDCQRDFTYIDDIIEGVFRVISAPPKKNLGKDGLPIPPYSLYNIGNHEPVNLMDFVNILSEELILAGVIDKDFELNNYMDLVPMQPGDVAVTYADMSDFESNFDYRPQTSLREGLKKFAEWYFSYYQERLNN